MGTRRALLIDPDPRFREVLQRSLSPLVVESHVAPDDDAWLRDLESSQYDLVIIAVDQPDAKGFTIFSKLKVANARVPVALVTATLSATEMGLHQKLRVHADVYIDKRTVGPGELIEKLGPYLEASAEHPTHPQPRDLADVLASDLRQNESWLDDFLDESLAGALRGLESEPTHERAEPALQATSERIAELETDLELAHRELQDARREARSSPFSGDFLSLRREASRRELDLTRLRGDIRARDDRIAQLVTLLEKLKQRVVPLTRERDLAVERADEMRSRTENAEAETHRAIAQSEEFRERLGVALRDAEAAVGLERVRAREAQDRAFRELKAGYSEHSERKAREHSASMETLRKQHEDELAQLRRAHEKLLRERDESVQAATEEAVVRERAVLQAKLETLEQARQRELAALRAKHAGALATMEQAQRAAVAKLEKAAREDKDLAVAAEEATFRGRLETQRREHEAQLATLQKLHHDALVDLRSSKDAELADQERKLRAALSGAAADAEARWQKQLEDAARQHAGAVAALGQQHEADLAALRSECAERQAICDREEAAARSRDLAQERARSEARIQELTHEHEKAMAGLRSGFEEQLVAARAETRRKTMAEKARLETQHEALRQHHALELETLRSRCRDDVAAVRRDLEESLAKERLRTPPDVAEQLQAADQRARESEAQLQEAVRALLERDSAISALQQELVESGAEVVNLKDALREVSGTVKSLAADGAPPDVIAAAVESASRGKRAPSLRVRKLS